MEVVHTPLANEINKIITAESPITTYTYMALVHLNDVAIDVQAYKVTAIDYVRKYNENFADEIIVDLRFLRGTYGYKIFPNKENIEVTIIQKPRYVSRQSLYTRYVGVVIEDINPLVGHDGETKLSEEDMNRLALLDVKIQLIPKMVYTMRTVEMGTVFKQSNVKDILLTSLGHISDLVNAQGGTQILGIDVVEPDNKETMGDVVFKHGIRAHDIPNYLQKELCGVYTNGLSHYIQDQYWYVFPIYDKNRKDSSVRFLNVINVPRNRFLGIDRTYRTDGEDLYVIAYKGTKQANNKLIDKLNYGNGIRFQNPNTIMDAITVEKADNKAKVNRTLSNTEVIGTELGTGDVFAPISNESQTANTFKQVSKLNSRNGTIVSVIWENSDKDLIKPGMMVNYIYSDSQGLTKTVKGALIQAHHFISAVNPEGIGDQYQSITALFIFCEDFE